MAGAQLATNGPIHSLHQGGRERRSGLHEQEQQHPLIGIGGPPLADADRVGDLVGELAFNDSVDLCRSKSHAGGVEHPVRAAMKHELFRGGMD
jgi:hypothetical protein